MGSALGQEVPGIAGGGGAHLGVRLETGGAPEAGRGVEALGAQPRERGT